MTRILVTGAGSGVALSTIKALKRANQLHNRGYRISAADSSWKAGSLYTLDQGYLIPKCADVNYISRLQDICKSTEIDYLIPGTDLELNALLENRASFEENCQTHVVINPETTITTGFDKLRTAHFLEENCLPFPATVRVERDTGIPPELPFPYILKPRFGSGSVGLSLVRTSIERERHLSMFPEEMVAQEFIDGEEFTCGLAFGADGTLLSSIVLQRTLKKGFTQFATVVDAPLVKQAIEVIAQKLPGRGAYNIQGRLKGDKFVVFEINPRFSGTTCFRAVAGQNEPDLYIQHHLGKELPSPTQIWFGLSMARYLNEFYFDESAADELRLSEKVQKSGFTFGFEQ